jgi:tetratricopeptide (TPR) repeat protein
LEPDEVAFHRVLGVMYYLQDSLNMSLKAYRRALEIEPQDTLSHYGIGLGLDALNRSDDAFFAYLQASRCDPDDPWPHLRLAGLLKRGVRPVGYSLSPDGEPSQEPEGIGPLPRSSQAAIQKHLWQALLLLEEKDHWGHAILAALQGRREAALHRVQQAVTLLPASADWLQRDPDLESLQVDERFWLTLLSAKRRLG